MSPRATGKVVRTHDGADLVVERRFVGTPEDVWESITASTSTARWIGPWTGEPSVGNTVTLVMQFEEGAPACPLEIEACDPPRRLVVASKGEHGGWRMSFALRAEGDETVLVFTQHGVAPEAVASAGPGWEYYLDRIVAARTGAEMPEFSKYYPSQKEHYVRALEE